MASITSGNPLTVFIPSFIVSSDDKTTHYTILVSSGSFWWNVNRRYSSFAELHDSLVINHGLVKDLLPPKKLIGNKNPSFIEKRRKELEQYLQKVVSFMSIILSGELADFLDLKCYEVSFLLQILGKQFLAEGEQLVKQPLTFNPLQLMCISQQLKTPHPLLNASDNSYDFANVIDVCSYVKHLVIEGSFDQYKSSNIILNELSYSLCFFKSIENLNIFKASICKIEKLGPLRQTVKKVVLSDCLISKICDFILCDFIHKEIDGNSECVWPNLSDLDLSSNSIVEIDKSVILLPNIENLNLTANRLSGIGPYLTKLPKLISLNLSNNNFINIEALHTKLGNIKLLNLSQNKISDISGLSKLYSLVTLNLASNCILHLSKVEDICNLPCLEDLLLTGNPVATVIDYRTKVLEMFGKRSCELCLDNERPTQKELDKVSVLQALRTAREGRMPSFQISLPVPVNDSLQFQRPDVATIAKENSS